MTEPLRGMEYAVDLVSTYLQENLPDYIATVNAQHAGDDRGILIEMPGEESWGVAEFNWRTLPPTPCVALLGEETTIFQDSANYLTTRHPMNLIVVDMDADQNVLRRKMYRHVQALQACLLHGFMTGEFRLYWQSGLTLARFTPVGFIDGTYATDAQLYFEIELEDSYA